MKYDARDLRAADLFGLVLIALGGILFVLGIFMPDAAMARSKAGTESVVEKEGASTEVETDGAAKKAVELKKEKFGPGLSAVALGIVFLCLGAAVNLQLRRVVDNQGDDLGSYYDVDTTGRPTE